MRYSINKPLIMLRQNLGHAYVEKRYASLETNLSFLCNWRHIFNQIIISLSRHEKVIYRYSVTIRNHMRNTLIINKNDIFRTAVNLYRCSNKCCP